MVTGTHKMYCAPMALVVLFVLGVANFALSKAVLDSGHPMLGRAGSMRLLGGRLGLAFEFVVLLGSMAMVNRGTLGWAWAYGGYTLANAAGAWLVLSRRV
jgi:hypothetical protein